jgi:hypothetical protein
VPKRKPIEPPWQIILEEIRSQNRATIEAVEATRTALEDKISHVDEASQARDGVLELAIRDLAAGHNALRSDVSALRGDVDGLRDDVKGLRGDVSALRGDFERLSSA